MKGLRVATCLRVTFLRGWLNVSIDMTVARVQLMCLMLTLRRWCIVELALLVLIISCVAIMCLSLLALTAVCIVRLFVLSLISWFVLIAIFESVVIWVVSVLLSMCVGKAVLKVLRLRLVVMRCM